MKRILLFFIFAVFTMTSSMAQINGIGRGAVRTSQKATAVWEKLALQIQQQSQRTSQAAFSNGIKITPLRMSVIPLPNLDTDDQKREKERIKGTTAITIAPATSKIVQLSQIPKIKSFREVMDEIIANSYDEIQNLVKDGAYDHYPQMLLSFADYAQRHDDSVFVLCCLQRIAAEKMTPRILKYAMQRYPELSAYMPELARSVVIHAYTQMLTAKIQRTDCDSARVQHGDTLLIVTDQVNPSLNPLVVLSCFYDPVREVERYKEAADSIISTYNQWSDGFKETFARDFIFTLMDERDYYAALDYFGREPLKQFPDSIVDYDLDLVTCSIITQNDTLFARYLRQAYELDSVATENYWAQLYNGAWEQFTADPSQTELADWLIESSPTPADKALDLSIELIDRYWSDIDYSWAWETLSDYTPERETARRAILHILDKGVAIDEGCSETIIAPYISFIKAEMLMADPAMIADVKSMLDNLTSIDQPDLLCRVIIGQAYIAAHGLDKPKKAMKILRKNIKLLDNPLVIDYTRDMWYEYMAALATRLGKTKDAAKYLKLKKETI